MRWPMYIIAAAAIAPNTTKISTTAMRIFTSGLVFVATTGTWLDPGAAYAAGGGTTGDADGTPALGCATAPTRVPHFTQNPCPSANGLPQFLQKPAMNFPL